MNKMNQNVFQSIKDEISKFLVSFIFIEISTQRELAASIIFLRSAAIKYHILSYKIGRFFLSIS